MSMESPDQRRLAAIMFTDIVGYSAITQRNEALALALLSEHNRIVRATLTSHRGKEIKTVGDAFLVEFISALDAVHCAIAIQRALHERNGSIGKEPIHVRIGIHLGDVVYRDGDVFGDGVNIASRIQSVASTDGICISQDVARQVQNKLDMPLVNLGRGTLKNIELPVDVYAVQLAWAMASSPESRLQSRAKRLPPPKTVATIAALTIALGGGAWYFRSTFEQSSKPGSGVTEAAKSIAVLPFVNLSGNKEDDYFGDGITEDLLTQLAQISELKVISRTSVMQYKDTKKSIRDIARELGVAHILEGSVRRSDNRFRINAQLIDAQRDEHLWAKTYDRDIKDILIVQSDVTNEIAHSLKAKLLGAEKDQLEKHTKGNPEAYLAYLKGMHLLSLRVVYDKDAYAKAVPFFQQVISLDPESPLGYLGMANYHILQARLGFVSPEENLAIADKFVLKALALDNQSVDAYILLSKLRGPGQWNWSEAEKAAKRAIELNPGNSAAWDNYSFSILLPKGRTDEALVAFKRAKSLNPVDQEMAWRLAFLYEQAGQCDETIRLSQENAARDPTYTVHYALIASCLEQRGKIEEAIAMNRLVKAYWIDDAVLDIAAQAYKREGNKGYFRAMFNHNKELAAKRKDVLYYAARYAAQAGDWDTAFEYVGKTIDTRGRNVTILKTDPVFTPVRNDPRFKAALKRLNLD